MRASPIRNLCSPRPYPSCLNPHESSVPAPLALGTSGGNQTLTFTLLPRSTGATNADGPAGLNLSGAALQTVSQYRHGAGQ